MSHPTRVRGLKLGYSSFCWFEFVAPHTGAWIETWDKMRYAFGGFVAPHTGAWIETTMNLPILQSEVSHPTRVRGLKQKLIIESVRYTCRTPHGCVD